MNPEDKNLFDQMLLNYGDYYVAFMLLWDQTKVLLMRLSAVLTAFKSLNDPWEFLKLLNSWERHSVESVHCSRRAVLMDSRISAISGRIKRLSLVNVGRIFGAIQSVSFSPES